MLGDYPPVGHLLAVLLVSDTEQAGLGLADNLRQVADSRLTSRQMGYSIGPAPAAIGKIKDKFRTVLYIKSREIETLVEVKDLMEEYIREHPDRRVLTFFDFDPTSSL